MLAFGCLHGLPEPALLITAGAADAQHPRKELSQTSSSKLTLKLTAKAPTAPRALDRAGEPLGAHRRSGAEEREGGLPLGDTRQN